MIMLVEVVFPSFTLVGDPTRSDVLTLFQIEYDNKLLMERQRLVMRKSSNPSLMARSTTRIAILGVNLHLNVNFSFTLCSYPLVNIYCSIVIEAENDTVSIFSGLYGYFCML